MVWGWEIQTLTLLKHLIQPQTNMLKTITDKRNGPLTVLNCFWPSSTILDQNWQRFVAPELFLRCLIKVGIVVYICMYILTRLDPTSPPPNSTWILLTQPDGPLSAPEITLKHPLESFLVKGYERTDGQTEPLLELLVAAKNIYCIFVLA